MSEQKPILTPKLGTLLVTQKELKEIVVAIECDTKTLLMFDKGVNKGDKMLFNVGIRDVKVSQGKEPSLSQVIRAKRILVASFGARFSSCAQAEIWSET